MKLHISDQLSLPREAVTQTFAILAKRGVGKTYTASVLAEELLKAGLQTVVVDPIGVWWGLRAGADGKREGLEIIVMGGDHGDLPLEVAGGEVVASFVVESGRSVVLDLSNFRKSEQTRFMTDFAETLYRLNREPLHLIVDEADAFAPQRPMDGEQRLLGAFEDIVRRGRARGLGVTLVTQRAAVLNKNVLTQIEVLVALRTIAPQDRDTIDDWTKIHGTTEQRAELMASLASLPIGKAWFWSPGWLNLFKCVQVRPRETFDSSSTPKVGEKPKQPKKLRPVDLETLREKMSATIEQAKANDPRQLRKRIADLEQEIGRLQKQAELERPALSPAQVEELKQQVAAVGTYFSHAESAIKQLTDMAQMLHATANLVVHATSRSEAARQTALPTPTAPAPASPRPSPGAERGSSDGAASRPQQRILDALATLKSLGIRDAAKGNVAVFADQSPTSSGFQNNLGALRTAGLICYPSGGRVALTMQGEAVATPSVEIGSLGDLHHAWYSKLERPKAAIVRALVEIYPNQASKVEIADKVGQSATSSGYQNNLGALRSLGLIEYPRPGELVATDLLFPVGLRE